MKESRARGTELGAAVAALLAVIEFSPHPPSSLSTLVIILHSSLSTERMVPIPERHLQASLLESGGGEVIN